MSANLGVVGTSSTGLNIDFSSSFEVWVSFWIHVLDMNYYDTAFAVMIYDVKEYEVGAKPNQESLSAAMLWLCYVEGALFSQSV